MGRRGPQAALCKTCVDNGCATTFGVWIPSAPLRFRRHVGLAVDSAQRRNAVLDEFESRCNPSSFSRDIVVECPWVVELRRASSGEVRSASLRVADTSPVELLRFGGCLGQRGEDPSEGASLPLMTAQFSGAGSTAEKVALESVNQLRLSRA